MPTLRNKKRYVLYGVVSKNSSIDEKLVFKEIKNMSLRFLGEAGFIKSGIKVLSETWNPKLARGIISTNHQFVDHIRAMLMMMHKVGEKEIIIKTIKTSGLINKLQKIK